MHIAVCGPTSLNILESAGLEPFESQGYSFPMTSYLVLAYLNRGHRVSVITTGTDIQKVEYRAGLNGLDVWVVPSRPRARDRALDFFKFERQGIVKAIEEARPDVVHAHWTYEFALAANETGLPRLITAHDWAPAIFRRMKDPYRFIRMLMQFSVLARESEVTAPSIYVANKIEKWFRITCTIVRNGIPVGDYVSAANGRDKRPSDDDWIPAIGMLNATDDSRKNVRNALRAWGIVIHSLPQGELHLAGGDFSQTGECAVWAKRNGLDHRVKFVGPLDPKDVPAWMGSLDIFLHPSLEESFGLVLCEAMAAGTVVVAGERSGAVAEVVGEAGVLTDVRSPLAISQALLHLLSDRSQLDGLMAESLIRVRAFDIAKVADEYLDLLGRRLHEGVS